MIMDRIMLETAEGLAEAVAFANCQFGLDFRRFQPKIYGFPDGGETYTYRKNGEIAGMLSVYPCTFQIYKCLSVGTVCTAPAYRGQGIMTALFTWLQEAVFPGYDIITLCGKRERYEHFGFAKAMTYPEYWFCPRNSAPLHARRANEGDKMLLHDLWDVYGNGVRRPLDRIFYILKSAGHEVLLLSDGIRWGYLAWKPQKRLVTEYCGPWQSQDVADSLAPLCGNGKIGMMGKFNCQDVPSLQSCDSYLIRNHGNVWLKSADVKETYDICGYGGKGPKLILPTSLFFLDGI